MLYLVIFFVLVLILLLFIIRVNIILDYRLNGLDDQGIGSISLFGGRFKYNIKLPVDAGKDKKTEGTWLYGIYDKTLNLKEIYSIFENVKKYLGKKILIKKLAINVEIGVTDAFLTGFASGFAWTVLGILTSFVLNSFKKHRVFNQDIHVDSLFNENRMAIELYCIFTIKIVHIIVVGFKFLPYFVRNNKSKKGKKNKGGVVSV